MVAKAPCSNELRLIAGRANPELAKEIASILSVPLCDIRITTFADSETHVQIEESVRGKDVFIIQPTCPPVNETLMELLIMIDACRRASARQITAIVPYFGCLLRPASTVVYPSTCMPRKSRDFLTFRWIT